jgi:hypothetical protein
MASVNEGRIDALTQHVEEMPSEECVHQRREVFAYVARINPTNLGNWVISTTMFPFSFWGYLSTRMNLGKLEPVVCFQSKGMMFNAHSLYFSDR